MSFSSFLSSARRIGRKLILPSDQIKDYISECVGETVHTALDLGSGTLYWSYWLADSFGGKVAAVDPYYRSFPEKIASVYAQRIQLYADYFECVSQNKIDLLWMCDVLHHLDRDFEERLFASVTELNIPYVVIKDIDCRHRFGNKMNRFHDLIINHEKIRDVDPQELMQLLRKSGYAVSFRYLPKLWYPHFIMAAIKEQN